MLFGVVHYLNEWHLLSSRMGDIFNMHMHHGGTFQRYPQVKYIGMKVDVWDNRDPDFISYFELVDMVKELGYDMVSRIWYILKLNDPHKLQLQILKLVRHPLMIDTWFSRLPTHRSTSSLTYLT